MSQIVELQNGKTKRLRGRPGGYKPQGETEARRAKNAGNIARRRRIAVLAAQAEIDDYLSDAGVIASGNIKQTPAVGSGQERHGKGGRKSRKDRIEHFKETQAFEVGGGILVGANIVRVNTSRVRFVPSGRRRASIDIHFGEGGIRAACMR